MYLKKYNGKVLSLYLNLLLLLILYVINIIIINGMYLEKY